MRGEATNESHRRRHVVIVEDAADMADVLKDILEHEGYDVSVATDGVAGLALIRATHPDLVLCDISLPRLDGHQIARAVREDPSLAGTRLLALSGWSEPEDLSRAEASGFERVLAKPVEMDLVIREVARATAT